MSTAKKLQVLARIGSAFGAAGLTWAVGGSLLLYLEGVVEGFSDLDLLVQDSDYPRAHGILEQLGTRRTLPPNPGFATPFFGAFTVEGVEVDLMANLTILYGGIPHPFPLLSKEISHSQLVEGVPIPLHSLSQWRLYYQLMNRPHRVAEIDRFLAASKIY